MKTVQSYLKYGAFILGCITLLVVLNRFKGCPFNQDSLQSTTVPSDSNFAPTTRKNYQPPSLPFSKRRLDVALPKGLKEKDVRKVTSIEVSNVPAHPPKKIDIIETRSGETFVGRDSSIRSISITIVQPPILSFSLRFGFGSTLARSKNAVTASPAAVFAPVEWSGWIHAPTLVADFDGIGPGAQLSVYHDIYAGASRLWLYEGGDKIKLSLVYMLPN